VVGEDALAIVGVEELEEEVGIGQPLVRRVADELLDLRADVDGRCRRGLVDVGDERYLLHEFAVPAFGSPQRLDRVYVLVGVAVDRAALFDLVSRGLMLSHSGPVVECPRVGLKCP
jgi:hypothetical protein